MNDTLDEMIATMEKYGAKKPFVVFDAPGGVTVMELWRYLEQRQSFEEEQLSGHLTNTVTSGQIS